MSNDTLLFILGILIGYLLFKIIEALFYTRTTTKTIEMPAKAEDNDFVKWQMNCQETTIRMAVHAMTSAWFLPPEASKILDISQVSLYNTIAVLPVKNFLFRWYFDWKHNIMVAGFTTNDQKDNHYIERKSFKISGGTLNFEALYMFYVSLWKKYYKFGEEEVIAPDGTVVKITESELEGVLKKVLAEYKDIPASLKKFYEEWRKDILENGANQEEMAKFIYFALALNPNVKEVRE